MLGTETLSDQVIVPSPTVEPFSEQTMRNCRCCGTRVTRWDRLVAYLRGRGINVLGARYCAGGKPPTEERRDIQAMMTGQTEMFNPCAGVTRPHLHLSCGRCGFSLLMQTKDALRSR